MRHDPSQNVELAKELVSLIEQGEHDKAKSIVLEMSKIYEESIFFEVGKLTRELHNALVSFGLDANIAELAEYDIPDAKARLSHVIDVTENAANTAMNVIEQLLPICEEYLAMTERLSGGWNKFLARDMSADDFRAMANEISDYFTATPEAFTRIRNGLNEIMMSQEYQDITGQMIKKVIVLVQDVEENLIRVIKATGIRVSEKKNDPSHLQGPVVPGVSNGDVVSDQDDVDDLLSSLGF